MNKVIFLLTIFLSIYACSGGGGESSSTGSLARPALNSTIDLRLGQLSSNSGPVAVSAALENGESITAFTTGDNLAQDFDVIYVGPNSQTILVNLDSTGRPKLAQFQNITITYSNYTKENTVDINIQTQDSARTARSIFLPNQAINQNVLDYLNGDEFLRILLGIDQDIDSGLRTILAATVGALRLIACGSEETVEAIKDFIPEEFLSNLCTSELLKAIEDILGFSNYQAITVNLTNRHSECDNPQGYEQLSICALVIWEDLTKAVEQSIVGDFPRKDDDGNDTDGGKDSGSSSNGGTNSGTNTTGSNTGGSETGGGDDGGSGVGGNSDGASNGGSGGILTGTWSGAAVVDAPVTNCVSFSANFTVKRNSAGGDDQCQTADCFYDMDDFLELVGGPQFNDFHGTVNSNSAGNIAGQGLAFGPGSPYLMEIIQSQSVLRLNGTGSLRFRVTANQVFVCEGTMLITRSTAL